MWIGWGVGGWLGGVGRVFLLGRVYNGVVAAACSSHAGWARIVLGE